MNQDIGKIIKEIRIKNNLTQKDLANKLGVTYQAVSKWENGKNIPDISILKQISNEYNIDINNLLDGNNKKKKNQFIVFFSLVLIIVLFIFLIIAIKLNDNYTFKTLSTSCAQFNISGSISYNKAKSSIYISNVKYCGGDDTTKYKDIKCILYEKNNNTILKISDYNYLHDKAITLETFLQDVQFIIDNYSSTCKNYKTNSLYIEIKATDESGKITNYEIPLTLEDNC